MNVNQVQFVSLSRIPGLKGQKPEDIKAELTAKYGGQIDLDLDGDMAIIST